uniref:CHAT domain-containing protein n=1 Tax=Grammatophora oceanica TaxID=210454 RepID=A0A7S1UTK6_9STRA|mmetsp:Transcript_2197/g.2973  ORF Transcript_2197/g.2973 Transcript_2197/m.2973 type:complete len:1368 (+) Transcript_2197:207-4310(+)
MMQQQQHPQLHRRVSSDASSDVPAILSSSASSYTLDSSQCSSQGSSRQPDLLTVFQAAPLVYQDIMTGEHVPLGLLDFQQERHILEAALRDAHMDIDLSFDIATSDRLGAFLAKREGRVLHFSCHGHEKFLAIENGLGKMQALEVPNLKSWISAGGNHLQFVFVSACHSRKAGEAFVEAGVPHVVCCRHDDAMLRDAAAIEFSKAFYTALACGTPLDRAFELGQRQVENAPEIPASARQTEVSKFVLLPEGKDHHVQIFNPQGMWRSPMRLTTSSLMDSSSSHQIPFPPDIFEGRQVDVHKLLVALRSARLVRIAGPKGIGKVSVVQAACHYMRERPHSFPNQIRWLPSDDMDGDELTTLFSSIFNVLESEPESSLNRLDNDSWFTQCRRKILRTVGNQRFVLVLETRRLSGSEARFRKIASMLTYLIRNTQHVRAIVIHDVAELGVRYSGYEKDLVLAPLDFEATVYLFGRLCQHVAEQRCPEVSNFRELGQLLLPAEGPVDKPRSSRCREIFKMIGEGIPTGIHDKAKRMSGKDYDKLISLGRRMEQKLQFSTRAAFDKRLDELTTELNHHVETRQFLKAQECKELLDEMEVIKEDLPDLDTLKSMRNHTELDLDRAVQLREYLSADQMQDQLNALVAKIQAEKDARRELGLDTSGLDDEEEGDDEELDVKQKRTRAEICSIVDALERQLDTARDENDFAECRRLDGELEELIRERDALPSTEMLLLKVSELEHNLKIAKTQRDWDEAQRVHDRLQQAQERLRVERQAEDDLGVKAHRRPSEAIAPGAVAVGPVAAASAVTIDRPSIPPGVSKDAIRGNKATTESTCGEHEASSAGIPPALAVARSSGTDSGVDGSSPRDQEKSDAETSQQQESGNFPIDEEGVDRLGGLPVAKLYQPEKGKRKKSVSTRRLTRNNSNCSDEDQRMVNSVSFTVSPTSSSSRQSRRSRATSGTVASDPSPEDLRGEFRRARETARVTSEELPPPSTSTGNVLAPSRSTDSTDDARPSLSRTSSVGTFSLADDKTESSVLVIDDASVFSSSADGSASFAGQISQMSQDEEWSKKAEEEAIMEAGFLASRTVEGRPLPPASLVPPTATVQHATSATPTAITSNATALEHSSTPSEPPEAKMQVFDLTGRVVTAVEQAKQARKKGVCAHCGVRTHEVKPFSRTPLTTDDVYNGNCIQHSPAMVPPVVYQDWERKNSLIVQPSTLALTRPRRVVGIHPPASRPYVPNRAEPSRTRAASSDTVVTGNSTQASSSFSEWQDAFLTVAAAGGSSSNLGPTSAPYPSMPAPQANAFVSPYSHNDIMMGQMDQLNSRTYLLDELVNAEIQRRTVPATKVEKVKSPKDTKSSKGFRLMNMFGKKK